MSDRVDGADGWSARIVREGLKADTNVSEVARRRGLRPWLLYTCWREAGAVIGRSRNAGQTAQACREELE
jgi:transposase-like protein